MQIAIGDEVRVHYHPPGEAMSFAEGVVSRIDVTTLRGRMFVIDVTYEVILDREQRIRPGYRNYVLYEVPDDFSGRIELLPRIQREAKEQPVVERIPEAEPLQIEIERDHARSAGNVVSALLRRSR